MSDDRTTVWYANVADVADLWAWRRACTDQMWVWECDDIDIDAVLLIVSELATNAFVHGSASSVDVCLRQTRDVLDIEVMSQLPGDGGIMGRPAPPQSIADAAVPAGAETLGIGGRGLLIVRALSDAYEVESSDGRRVDRAWFVLGRKGSESEPPT